jgi:hypothetical protein
VSWKPVEDMDADVAVFWKQWGGGTPKWGTSWGETKLGAGSWGRYLSPLVRRQVDADAVAWLFVRRAAKGH